MSNNPRTEANASFCLSEVVQFFRNVLQTQTAPAPGPLAIHYQEAVNQAPDCAPTHYQEAATQTSDCDADDKTASSVSARSSEGSSDGSRNWINRSDEATILAIPGHAFKELLLHHLGLTDTLDLDSCQIVRRTEGSFHHCVILSLEGHGRFVIKVPFTGTADLWQEGDAHNIRSEAQTMNYIRRHTRVPIPEVLAFDDSLQNVLSAPYILMRAIEGKPAQAIWIHTNSDGTPDYTNADAPSPALYARRCNFLKSLAYTMAELQKLQFDKMGMLIFDAENPDTPQVGHYFRDDGDGGMKQMEAYSSNQAYLEAILEETRIQNEDDSDILYGVTALFELIYKSAPFKPSASKNQAVESPNETFVLAHPDLDLQNIYVDDSGNVVGLIDWDKTVTVPRYIGYSCHPLLLRKDWLPDYDIEADTHAPWVLEHYRGLYTRYMTEALSTSDSGPGDAKYTPKSALYHAAFYAFGYDGQNAPAFVERLFKMLPGLWAVDKEKFLTRLGSDEGWSEAEDMLIRDLEKLFRVE